MKMVFKKSLTNGFVPDDEAAQRLWDRAKPGELIVGDCKLPKDQRSIAMLGLYFKVLTHLFENLPETVNVASVNAMRQRIFFEIGFTEVIETKNGPKEVPRSMSFDNIGQFEFHSEVWDPTIKLIDKMAPGLGDAFNAEYAELVG